MANYLLDSGILLGFVRGAGYAAYVDAKFSPMKPPNIAMISVVTTAELRSMALRRNWGNQKLAELTALFRNIPAVPIRQRQIIEKFAEIDAFNHRSHPQISPPTTAHTMGDNDIWIAATAAVVNATLLTTDRDFNHLDGVFLKVIYIDQKLTPADV